MINRKHCDSLSKPPELLGEAAEGPDSEAASARSLSSEEECIDKKSDVGIDTSGGAERGDKPTRKMFNVSVLLPVVLLVVSSLSIITMHSRYEPDFAPSQFESMSPLDRLFMHCALELRLFKARLIEKYPDQPQQELHRSLTSLADLKWRSGDMSGAQPLLEEIVKLNQSVGAEEVKMVSIDRIYWETNPVGQANYRLAYLYSKQGRWKEVAALLDGDKHYTCVGPHYLTIHKMAAEAFKRIGKTSQASDRSGLAELSRITPIEVSRVESELYIGAREAMGIYAGMGCESLRARNYPKARKYFSKIASHPLAIRNWIERARVMMFVTSVDEENYARARQELEQASASFASLETRKTQFLEGKEVGFESTLFKVAASQAFSKFFKNEGKLAEAKSWAAQAQRASNEYERQLRNR